MRLLKENLLIVYAIAIEAREKYEREELKYDSDSAMLQAMRQDYNKLKDALAYGDVIVL